MKTPDLERPLAQVPPNAQRRTSWDSKTDEEDNRQDCSCPYRYPTHEINYNALNAHCTVSVDRIKIVRNVTLITKLSRGSRCSSRKRDHKFQTTDVCAPAYNRVRQAISDPLVGGKHVCRVTA